jgi:hypothetical protein
VPKYVQVGGLNDSNLILGSQGEYDEDSDYDEESDSDLDDEYYEDFSETEDSDSEDL